MGHLFLVVVAVGVLFEIVKPFVDQFMVYRNGGKWEIEIESNLYRVSWVDPGEIKGVEEQLGYTHALSVIGSLKKDQALGEGAVIVLWQHLSQPEGHIRGRLNWKKVNGQWEAQPSSN
jgi:hypothetical protein